MRLTAGRTTKKATKRITKTRRTAESGCRNKCFICQCYGSTTEMVTKTLGAEGPGNEVGGAAGNGPPEPARLDLRGVGCPLTFVRTRVALDRLPRGVRLEVLLDDGEPSQSVPRSCAADGEVVLSVEPSEWPGVTRMVVMRRPL